MRESFSSLLFVVVIEKKLNKSYLERKWFISAYTFRSQSTVEKSKGRNQWQGSWRIAAYWLSGSGSCSVSFLIQSKSTCPGMVSPPTSGLDLSESIDS